jgi:hypothetical protein
MFAPQTNGRSTDSILGAPGGALGLIVGIGAPIFYASRDEIDEKRLEELRELNRQNYKETGEYLTEVRPYLAPCRDCFAGRQSASFCSGMRCIPSAQLGGWQIASTIKQPCYQAATTPDCSVCGRCCCPETV